MIFLFQGARILRFQPLIFLGVPLMENVGTRESFFTSNPADFTFFFVVVSGDILPFWQLSLFKKNQDFFFQKNIDSIECMFFSPKKTFIPNTNKQKKNNLFSPTSNKRPEQKSIKMPQFSRSMFYWAIGILPFKDGTLQKLWGVGSWPQLLSPFESPRSGNTTSAKGQPPKNSGFSKGNPPMVSLNSGSQEFFRITANLDSWIFTTQQIGRFSSLDPLLKNRMSSWWSLESWVGGYIQL